MVVFFFLQKILLRKIPRRRPAEDLSQNMTKNPKELMQLLVADNSNSDSFVSQIWGGRYAKEIQDFRGDNG